MNNLKKELSFKRNKRTPQQIDDLIKLNQELTLYQNHIDTKEELNTLPKLELKDIPPTINFLNN